MDRTHVQMLLASAGYYAGAIDGIAGPKTMTAVEITEAHAGDGSSAWPTARRLVAAGQQVLNAQGFEAGAVDGWDGALLHKSADGRSSPFPGQTYPTGSVTGMPSAVYPFRTAIRT